MARRRGVGWFFIPALTLILVSCGSRTPPTVGYPFAPATNEFSIMTYNLHQYGLHDRDGMGLLTPKPPQERDAVLQIIATVKPDVLAVQEIGNPAILHEFHTALRDRGLDYPHVEYLQRGLSELNMAVFSRFPIVDRTPRTEDRYTLGQAEVAVLRGFIDVEIEVNPQYRFRLMVAHLKSKVFHALGQTEMRRNEARLLNKHVRNHLKNRPDINLVVVGDLNDHPASAALREVRGSQQQYLTDLRPLDEHMDAWTHFDPACDEYTRIDYILVSSGMLPEVVREKTHAVRHALTYVASDHRPIVAVFKAYEVTPTEASVRGL